MKKYAKLPSMHIDNCLVDLGEFYNNYDIDCSWYTTARVFVLRIRVSCAFPTHCTCVEFKLCMKRESTYFETHEYSLAAL